MNNEDKIDLALDIFDTLSTNTDNLALVGGAPRDIILGKEIRDLDFVVNTTAMYKDRKFGRRVRDFIKDYKLSHTTDNYTGNYTGQEFIVSSSKDKVINLIQYGDTPRKFIDNHFDFGICCCLMTGEGELHVTDWFRQDDELNHLNLRVRDSLSEYSIGKAIKAHAPKLQEKYPRHTLIITENTSRPPTWSKL